MSMRSIGGDRVPALRLSRGLGGAWWDAYRAHSGTGTSQSAAATGSRRLANIALSYLTMTLDPKAIAAAKAQYDTAATMTDRMGALTALINTGTPERAAALADFHARFRHNPDVVDKWFTVQALSSCTDTLARVQGLLGHADFSVANPNRLRSLVGAFAANQVRFHAADGAGYRLLTDQLLAVDAINPQSAARLATALGRWRRFDPARGGLMRGQLERIAGYPGVSKDVLEMASRALA